MGPMILINPEAIHSRTICLRVEEDAELSCCLETNIIYKNIGNHS